MITVEELVTRLLWTGYRVGLRPVLFNSSSGDPERIHDRVLALLGEIPEPLLQWLAESIGRRRNPVEIAGIDFPGRVGVAAGLDKEGLAARAWGALGFGFAEFGTVTAGAQRGNRQPRLFRLPHSKALINRMGFNNSGATALAARLGRWGVRRGNLALGYPVGVSIGKTRTTPLAQATEDYLTSLRTLVEYVDYVAINVSSPNTPGLRSLQDRDALSQLTTAMVACTRELGGAHPLPVFVKLAPDLSVGELDALIEVCESSGVTGLIATNTTTGRERLHPSELWLATQAGGLSGAPLTARALRVVSAVTARTRLPGMGVGGIMTPADAQAMFDAGASLVQLYTGFIYQGIGLVHGINALTIPDRVTKR